MSRGFTRTGSNNLSFPSGHTADSFAIATVVHQYYGNTAGMIGYAAASFVALSRTREDRHWASDLAAGATIGYIVGRTVSHRTGISLRSRTVTFSPVVDPFRRRFGLQISIDDR